MPRIISFAWTSPALVAGHKTVTRRSWKIRYAEKFKAGDEVIAYDRSQRVGGRPIARLRLIETPYRQLDKLVPVSDYEAEGFAYMHSHPELLPKTTRGLYVNTTSRATFDAWRQISTDEHWVVRFELLEVLPHG